MRRSRATVLTGLLLLGLTLPLNAATPTRATVAVRLIDTLSTGSSQPGDSFTAVLATPLVVNDHIVAEKGARVTGQVYDVVSSSRTKASASITLRAKTVHAPEGRIPLDTGDLTIKAGPPDTRKLVIIGGAVGAAVGTAAAGRKGAAIGAAAGAGAGVAGAYLTGKREIVLPPETLLTFHVTSVVIGTQEMGRLQRVAHREGDTHSVAARRRHRDVDDEDEEEEDEEEIEYELEHPEKIEVEIEGHEAEVKIRWPRRIERLTLKGDDLEEIVEKLAERTGLSIELLRTKVKIKGKD